MPFIDLNSLNPLASKKSDGDQGSAAQTQDPQDTQPTTATDPTAIPDPAAVSDTTPIVAQQPELPPQQVMTPVELQPQMPEQMQSIEPVSIEPVQAAAVQQEVSLQGSSASDEPTMDRSGNPIPSIPVTQGGAVQVDESGMREVKGPEFVSPVVPSPSAVEQISSEPVESRLANLEMQPEVDQDEVTLDEVVQVMNDLAAEPASAAVPAPTAEAPIASPEPEQVTEPVQQEKPEVELMVPTTEVLPVVPVIPVNPVENPTPQAVKQDLAELNTQGTEMNLDELLEKTVSMHASDLHLTAGYRAMVRVDGQLQSLPSVILDDKSIKEMVKGLVTEAKVANPDDVRDLDLAYQSLDGTRFRVNIFKQQGTQSAVFRVIPSKIQSIDELSLPAKIREFTQMSQGLVLVTGPTGSGKSTTLAAMVNEINIRESRHIVTIEDPIEFVYPKAKSLVDQRGIKQDTDNWSNALRSVLRQDPNVVLIGEMRDLETIAAALHIAETGHLVFATLHTNSAAQSVDRIIDVFPKEQQAQIQTQLASVLKAVVSQRLIPMKGGGRKVAVEIMVTTPAVSNSIRSSKVYQIDNIIQTSGELGMISMEKSLVNLVREGSITTEQAQFYANRPDEITSLLAQR